MNPYYLRMLSWLMTGGLLGTAAAGYFNLRADSRLNYLLSKRKRYNEMLEEKLGKKEKKKEKKEKSVKSASSLTKIPIYTFLLGGGVPLGFYVTFKILKDLRKKRFKKELQRTARLYDEYVRKEFGKDTDVDELLGVKEAGDKYASLMDPNSSEAAAYLHEIAETLVDRGFVKEAIDPVDLLRALTIGIAVPAGFFGYKMVFPGDPALYAVEEPEDLEKQIRKIKEGPSRTFPEKETDKEKKKKGPHLYYFPGKGITAGIDLV